MVPTAEEEGYRVVVVEEEWRGDRDARAMRAKVVSRAALEAICVWYGANKCTQRTPRVHRSLLQRTPITSKMIAP